MTAADYILILGTGLLEIVEVMLIMCGILQYKPVKGKAAYILTGIVIFINYLLVFYYKKLIYLPFIMPLMQIFTAYLVLDHNDVKKIFALSASFFSYSILEEIMKAVLSILFAIKYSQFANDFDMKFLVRVLVIFVILIIIFFMNHISLKIYINCISLKNYFFYNLFVFICNYLIFYFGRLSSTSQTMSFDNLAILGLSIIFCLLMISMVFLILIKKSREYYLKQYHMQKYYIKVQKECFNDLNNQNNDIKKFKHDIKAHIYCLKQLIFDKDYIAAENYLLNIDKKILNLDNTITSGNRTVDTVLNLLQDFYKFENIKLMLSGKFPDKLKVESYDLCTIFYNTVTNAYEACTKLKSDRQYIIEVKITVYKNNLCIVIENPNKGSTNKEELKTSKCDKNNHGFGIENVRDTVNKYKGKFVCLNETDLFSVKIILYNIF